MKIRVQLYGTLRQSLPGDRQSGEIEIEMPEGATAADVLRLLGIQDMRGIVVVMGGRVLTSDDPVQPGASVVVFQAIGGG